MRKLSRIKTAGTFFTIIAIISLVEVFFSRKATLKKVQGKVAGVFLELQQNGRRFYSVTTFQLIGSSQKFVVTETGDGNSFTDRVNSGDTVTLYKKTLLHFLNGTFVRGNTFRVEKNGVTLYDDIAGLRTSAWVLFAAFGIVSLLGVWLYKMELKKIQQMNYRVTTADNNKKDNIKI